MSLSGLPSLVMLGVRRHWVSAAFCWYIKRYAPVLLLQVWDLKPVCTLLYVNYNSIKLDKTRPNAWTNNLGNFGVRNLVKIFEDISTVN